MLGLPVAALTVFVVGWGVRGGRFDGLEEVGGLAKQIEAFDKQRKQAKKDGEKLPQEKGLHGQWAKMGGGFYGMVALYTWLRIEWSDALDFLVALKAVFTFDIGGIIQAIISFFIESIMNFVAAVTWPVYWISNSNTAHLWVWFLVGWAGYWLGLKVIGHGIAAGWPVLRRDQDSDQESKTGD
ncbi:hypothetical protein F3N42_10850 [Marinihelvus fidelis]|uniref:Uncharacterized protein n=1 Tax=Marinihelvus fidelis TaxID=2613842 RepID=A0A5N0T8P3_9GAMM|nr:hypothetical protein [Marinihelvus fidelis]KAA9130854.1 hypothetical protein F3N42_10850 [Marinihelvus fidelis]